MHATTEILYVYALRADDGFTGSLVSFKLWSEADIDSVKEPEVWSLPSLSFNTKSVSCKDGRRVHFLISSSSFRPNTNALPLAYFEHAHESTCSPFGSLILIFFWLVCSSRIPWMIFFTLDFLSFMTPVWPQSSRPRKQNISSLNKSPP